MLQASFRHTAGQAEIHPLVWNQTSAREKTKQNKIVKSALLFLFKATTKTTPVHESLLGELYNRGCNKAKKKYFQEEKNIFPSYVLGKMKLRVETNIIFFCYTCYLQVLPKSFQEQVLFLLWHWTKLKVYPFWFLTFSSWQLNVRGRRPSTFNSTGKR